VERAEAALAAVEDELSDPALWSTPSRSERSTARHDAARRAVAEAYARWERASADGSST
jgi:ATP-binding cassette, subfamily F, member 3